MRIRSLAVPLLVAALLAATGCSAPSADEPSPTTTAAPEESFAQPEVVETAFGAYGGPNDGPEKWAWYLVLMENPNEVAVVSGAVVTVDLIGADGVLDTYSEVVDLLPGVSAVWDVTFRVPAADVIALEATLEVDPAFGAQIFLPETPAGSFEFSDLVITPNSEDPAGLPKVSGTVGHSFGNAVDGPSLTVVMRDPAGEIGSAMGSRVFSAIGTYEEGEFESNWFVGAIPAEYTLEPYASPRLFELGIDVPE